MQLTFDSASDLAQALRALVNVGYDVIVVRAGSPGGNEDPVNNLLNWPCTGTVASGAGSRSPGSARGLDHRRDLGPEALAVARMRPGQLRPDTNAHGPPAQLGSIVVPGCGRARSVPPAVQGLSRRLSLRGEAGEAEEGLADDLALSVEAVGFLIGDLNVNGYLRPRS